MAASWRDAILDRFTPERARLTLAADPDGLLLEEGVLAGIHARGFDLIAFDDPVAFRFAYESKYRERWDRGELTELVVVLRSPESDLKALPYDLFCAGHHLHFGIGELFPGLNPGVVRQLDGRLFDKLFSVLASQPLSAAKGEVGTKDYLLEQVFEIVPARITCAADLLSMLLGLHYPGLTMPPALEEHLITRLSATGLFEEWPLVRILADRAAFFGFIEERWPLFLDRLPGGGTAGQPTMVYGLHYPGPTALPFEDVKVRPYVDNVFLEGLLRPVEHARAEQWAGTWAAVGIRINGTLARAQRIERLLDRIEQGLPGEEARHQEWLGLAQRWAELLALWYADGQGFDGGLQSRLLSARLEIDRRFDRWIRLRYAGLYDQPPSPPVMLHHVPRHLHARLSDRRRVALLVVDGLSVDQWAAIRQGVSAAVERECERAESALFAWVPTLTAVSRQAAFAGRMPLYFSSSLGSTSREPDLWARFWEDSGVAVGEVRYVKNLGEGSLSDVEEAASHPKVRVIGLVISKVDKIMHGMELGTAGMHNQVRQWAGTGYLASLLRLLLQQRFEVHLTSDHGNIEATGIGRPGEGAAVEQAGERARIYGQEVLRDKVARQFPDAIVWPTLGLPADFLPLLAPRRRAFVRDGERVVGHGGIALEEVIVPFVTFSPRGAS